MIDVLPDGTAYNLDETIQRLRYRDGYDKPLVWMEPGKVYKVALQPMTTSNYFGRVIVCGLRCPSSNFPRFDRNMNTGGNNYDETVGKIAHTQILIIGAYSAAVVLSVVASDVDSSVIRQMNQYVIHNSATYC